jgi:hypothetical protein
MNSNKFLKKFSEKSDDELLEIINHPKKYVDEAREAASQILQHRKKSTEKDIPQYEISQEKSFDYSKVESDLKPTHSFGWKLKYEESFKTDLAPSLFVAIAIKAFERLEWDIVYRDETMVEAKRRNNWGQWTEKIIVQLKHGKAQIKSISLQGNLWDVGRNSKRVRLFFHVFQEVKKSYSNEELKGLETNHQEQDQWKDYEIPNSLPAPKRHVNPSAILPIIGGCISAVILGFMISNLSRSGLYIIGLFEFIIGFLLAYTLKYFIRWSNYTNFNRFQLILVGFVVIIYSSNLYFQYLFIIPEPYYGVFNFWDFLELRYQAGLQFKSLQLGSIGLIIFWLIQLILTYFIAVQRLTIYLIDHNLKRVPSEVLDYVFYLMNQQKSELEIRQELSAKGWTSKTNQDKVFAAISAVYDIQELRRMD